VVKDLEVRQAEVESRAPLMNMRVEEFREHLSSLHISDARYAELKAMPDDALHIIDLVKVSCCECISLGRGWV
jgi:demethoxyubiquinone hydroxylase (CLK1/Coq7/Cat5 family)